MAQWDVYENPSARARHDVPFLVVLQSDLLSQLGTRLVAPLIRSTVAAPGMPMRVSPRFVVRGELVTLMPQEAAPIDARLLRGAVANLRGESHRVVDALDTVVSGI